MKRLLSVLTAFLLAACFCVIPASAAEQKWQSCNISGENMTVGVPDGWRVSYPKQKLDVSSGSSEDGSGSSTILLEADRSDAVGLTVGNQEIQYSSSVWSLQNSSRQTTDEVMSDFKEAVKAYTVCDSGIITAMGTKFAYFDLTDGGPAHTLFAETIENGRVYSFRLGDFPGGNVKEEKAMLTAILNHSSIDFLPNPNSDQEDSDFSVDSVFEALAANRHFIKILLIVVLAIVSGIMSFLRKKRTPNKGFQTPSLRPQYGAGFSQDNIVGAVNDGRPNQTIHS